MKTNVDMSSYRWDNGDGENSKKPYSYRGTTDGTNSVNGLRYPVTSYSDLDVPFEVDPNKSYWIVWAEYSTGSSFGRDGGQTEIIDLFEDREMALKCVEAAKAATAKTWSMKYERQNGVTIDLHVPWLGYFESLEEIHVDCVRVIG